MLTLPQSASPSIRLCCILVFLLASEDQGQRGLSHVTEAQGGEKRKHQWDSNASVEARYWGSHPWDSPEAHPWLSPRLSRGIWWGMVLGFPSYAGWGFEIFIYLFFVLGNFLRLLVFLNWIFGVTLIHNTVQVSRVQLNKASSAHCIVCPLPQTKSLSVPICPFFAHLHLPPEGQSHR